MLSKSIQYNNLWQCNKSHHKSKIHFNFFKDSIDYYTLILKRISNYSFRTYLEKEIN